MVKDGGWKFLASPVWTMANNYLFHIPSKIFLLIEMN